MKDATEIVVILDKSGSMEYIQKDTIGGYNSFLKGQQKVKGEAYLSLVLFDTVVHEMGRTPLLAAEPLSPASYMPNGGTALLDAVGTGISKLGQRLSLTPEQDRPDKVIFVIITDGEENSSREFKKARIKEMIEHQQSKYSWQFLFLGANQDAFDEAGSIGIGRAMAANYCASPVGTRGAFAGATKGVESYRSCSSAADMSSWQASMNLDEVVAQSTTDDSEE